MGNEKWLAERVAYIKGLRNPNEQQRLLVVLAEKAEKTPADARRLSVLIRAERAAERVLRARAAANRIVNEERIAARKNRNHELFKCAGLLILAGLVDTKTGRPVWDSAELLGALADLAEAPHDEGRRQVWRACGESILSKKDATAKQEEQKL